MLFAAPRSHILSTYGTSAYFKLDAKHRRFFHVPFSSVTHLCPTFATLWTAAHQASLAITNSRRLLNSCPLCQWCHPTNLSSVVPLSFHLQSFWGWGSFKMSQFFTSGGQSIGVSVSTSVVPMNIEDWFPLGWTGWIESPRDSRESSPTPQFKSINSSALSFLYILTLTSIHDYWKNHSFD